MSEDNRVQPATLLHRNEQWAAKVNSDNPSFLPGSSIGPQTPGVLWIGCSDSRVPESVITDSMPGDIFVHRNIANQFLPGDASATAVLEFALASLKVQHIVIVGHTNCGAALASMPQAPSPATMAALEMEPDPSADVPMPALDGWLAELRKIAQALHEHHPGDVLRVVEENVRVQVRNVARSDVVRALAAQGQWISVHGWVYELKTGRLRDLRVPQPRPQTAAEE